MGKRFKKKFNRRQKKPYQKPNIEDSPNSSDLNAKDTETEFIIKESLKEDQVGITEYVNGGEGFNGILKSRFSDFHVNEIDVGGKILILNDLNIPEVAEDGVTSEEFNSAKEDLNKIISEDTWNQIDALKDAKNDNSPKGNSIVVDVSEMDKDQRTKFHKVIAHLYKNKLVSRTMKGHEAGNKDNEKRFIRVMKFRGHERNRWLFPGEIVHFLVHKENLDTSDVASIIATKLHLRPSQVHYSGTKDKRAKTTQKFCIKRRTPRQIAGAVKYLNGVAIGNFSFRSKFIKLGDLRGNRFRIAIRNLSGNRQHIETSLNNVKEQGFINYFGFQRFGNCSSIPTYEIGIALLKADYKLACELILKPRDNDVPFLKKIREMWWKNRNSKEAAAQFRSGRYIEKKVLDGLAEYGEKDYAAAIMKIPRNTLLLYPHAFQSLIFNYVASKRIKEFGLAVLPGDLVYIHKEERLRALSEGASQEDQDEEINNEDQDDDINNQDRDDDKEAEELSEQEDDDDRKGVETEESTTALNAKRSRLGNKRVIKHLSEEDISSGAYSIYDVLLTLPGHNVIYPENGIGAFYNEFMEKYDLSSENLKHNFKLFAMHGTYRKLLVKPREMSWEFKSYSTPDETLILSDLEVLQGKTFEDFKKDGAESKYEALLLDFCLPPGCYATMLLRELLKCDTSSAAQSILQQAAIKEHDDTINVDKDVQNSVTGEKRKTNKNENKEESCTSAKLLKSESK